MFKMNKYLSIITHWLKDFIVYLLKRNNCTYA